MLRLITLTRLLASPVAAWARFDAPSSTVNLQRALDEAQGDDWKP